MEIAIHEEAMAGLAEYATIPIAFTVDCVLDVTSRATGGGGFDLHERRLAAPYVKDYDAIAGNHPTLWPRRFDTAHWGFLAAHAGGRRAGGAVVAFRTPALDMLDGRADLAVLWDIRVDPAFRGQGIGTALFTAAEEWARTRGCRVIKVETQNVNVPACRFYARCGCELRAIHHGAYPNLPHEVQLLWYKDLSRPAGGERPR
jgi:GNAT superfamily N-acetyltransferase